MNNYSQNNYSKKNSKKFKNSNDSQSISKSSRYSESKKNSEKYNNLRRIGSNTQNEFNQSNSKKNEKYNSSSLRRRTTSKNSYKESSNKASRNFEEGFNKRNFDDWIWGKHSVLSALTSDRAINRIWCTSEIFSSEKFYILLKKLKSKGVLIEEVTWSRLSQLTYGATHQGVAMQLASSKSIFLSELIDKSKTKAANPILLALDGITDPHNLGAIIRSAEAFDCKGIIIPQRRSAGLTGTVAKVATGALEHIPVARVVNLNRALEELKRNGFITVGLSGEGQLSISEFNKKLPLVIVVGSEDKGISLLTQNRCDHLLKIPLKGKTSSLNASVAAAIALFSLTSK